MKAKNEKLKVKNEIPDQVWDDKQPEAEAPTADSQKQEAVYEVHIRAVKAKIPGKHGFITLKRGDIVSNPSEKLLAMAMSDTDCKTLALIKK